MSSRRLAVPCAALAMSLAASRAPALHIFVLSSNDANLDALFETRLEAFGHTVTMGPTFSNYNGSSLEQYDAILILVNNNWNFPAMSLQGQTNIYNYVLAGGGLVTTEWLMWSNGGGTGAWQPLSPTFAAGPTNGVYRNDASITYTARSTDPILTANLPASFTFTADSFSGTESRLFPKVGAASLFASDFNTGGLGEAGGVVGWGFGNGRVANFSTCIGTNQLSDANFTRLLNNVIIWTGSNPGCRADFDNGTGTGVRDGAVAIEDLIYYTVLFEAGTIEADVDNGSSSGVGDSAVDISDLLYYLLRFEAGC